MCKRECLSSCSLLLIKPEATIAGVASNIYDDIKSSGLVYCELPQIRFTMETANLFWPDLANKHSWAPQYYEYISSGPCFGLVLRGENSGVNFKKSIRQKYQETIIRLQKDLRLDFQPDLIHGSDPNQMEKEISIVCLLSKS